MSEVADSQNLLFLFGNLSICKLGNMQKQELAGEIGIKLCVQETGKISEKQIGFYRKYASVTQRILSKPLFQGFLGWMLTEENIEKDMISKVEVVMFPFRNEKGNGLAGRISRNGEIFIYPKRKEFCQKLMREFEKDKVYFYIKARAMAALIHELLHLRYASDEILVRRKTEEYLHIFIRDECERDPNTRPVLKMLFASVAIAC